MHTNALLAALLAPVASAQLNDLAVSAGLKYFGTALGESTINSDSKYASILNSKSNFGQLVPENGMKWDSTEPNRGSFNFNSGDITANQAKKNGQGLRCHTLVWYSQLPGWVSGGSWNRDSLTSVMSTHISNVMGHYKGQCYAWDVVNEAASDDGGWRPSVFYNTFGTDYFAIAFNLAKSADPNAKLYYNDYNLEYNAAKTDRAVTIVKTIQAAGAPIDGVGFQGHLIVGSTPSRSALATTLKRFTALGLEVAYTELDIRHSSLPASSSALATQGNDYANVVGSCIDVDGCIGVTIWGFTDKVSWVPGTFPGEGAALLWDENYNKKPAWSSVSSVLAAAATGNPPASSSTTLTTVTTTKPPVSTTTTTSKTTSASATPTGGSQQARWGQCGGIGWNGPFVCQSPWTCQKQNDWYSQCL